MKKLFLISYVFLIMFPFALVAKNDKSVSKYEKKRRKKAKKLNLRQSVQTFPDRYGYDPKGSKK